MKVPALSAAAKALLQAEATLRLLDRSVPTNLDTERARLLRAAALGQKLEPEFRYAKLADAGELRLALSALARNLSGTGPMAELMAGRAAELALEAALVEALGSPDFARLALERFPSPKGEEALRVAELLTAFDELEEPAPDDGVRIASDSVDPRSLLCVIDQELGAQRTLVRVVLRSELASVAATGDGVIYVRTGTLLSPHEAERIARHEVEAHALPRVAARSEVQDVFRVGSAGAGEDEEGRALLIELRSGLLGAERCRELGLRHRLALELRAGASLHDLFVTSRTEGCEPARALELALRVQRGGGLCREIVYLPAFLRVSAALSATPRLEDVMKRGRISVSAARALC